MLTTGQLALTGLGPMDLRSLVTRHVLDHPARGLYAVAELRSADAYAWHRQLVAGLFLLYPDAVLTGTSALLSHGIDVWGANLTVPEIVRPCHRGGGVKGVRVRRESSRRDAIEGPWGKTVPIADAVVQQAIDAGIVSGVVSADSALRQRKVVEEDLIESVALVRSWPQSSRASAMLPITDGRRENVAESRTAVTLIWAGYEVVPQVTIWDEDGTFVARVDFLIKGTKVVIEFDGKVKYADDDGTALFAEKKREDRLRRLGYIVVRVIWADLERPAILLAKVRQAMAIAALSA